MHGNTIGTDANAEGSLAYPITDRTLGQLVRRTFGSGGAMTLTQGPTPSMEPLLNEHEAVADLLQCLESARFCLYVVVDITLTQA